MRSQSRYPVNKRLYIGKLDKTVNSTILRKIFQQYGNLVGNPSVKNGFGFVEFDSFTSAKNAKEKENGSILKMNKIIVDYAKPRNNLNHTFQYDPVQNMTYQPKKVLNKPNQVINLFITHNSVYNYALTVQRIFLSFGGLFTNICLATNQNIINNIVSNEKYKILIYPDNASRSTVWFNYDKGYFNTNVYTVINLINDLKKKKEYAPCQKNELYDPCTKGGFYDTCSNN